MEKYDAEIKKCLELSAAQVTEIEAKYGSLTTYLMKCEKEDWEKNEDWDIAAQVTDIEEESDILFDYLMKCEKEDLEKNKDWDKEKVKLFWEVFLEYEVEDSEDLVPDLAPEQFKTYYKTRKNR
ncbi:MAG TPA: hypothetical protein PLQ36_03610, partial [Candidatus Gracilibacteria bacterium]|nr:hypothetical protein [Candidatus Gracilibacteria bacterium]